MEVIKLTRYKLIFNNVQLITDKQNYLLRHIQVVNEKKKACITATTMTPNST